MPNIPLRKLGHTDLEISALGLGAWQFSGGRGLIGGYWNALDAATTQAIVEAAVAAGINWFDTAEAYGGGESERNLSRALRDAGIGRDQVRIATKWWPVLRTADHLRASIDQRLACLGGYPIAHYIVHQPLSLSSIHRQMHTMADLLDEGRIGSVGISNFTARGMRQCHEVLGRRGYGLAAHQVRYSMLYRRIEHNGILAAAKELGVTIIAWSPLEQGLLTGCFHELGAVPAGVSWMRRGLIGNRLHKTQPLIDRMRALGEKYQATVSQIALNYLIHAHGDTVVAIPGASRVSQVEQNAGALRFRLALEDIEELSALC